MGTTIAILGSFTFLVALTVSPALCTCVKDGVTVTTETGFLIGENTPVWVADGTSPGNPVNYTMLDRGIVKEAIDGWRARPLSNWNNILHSKAMRQNNRIEAVNEQDAIEASKAEYRDVHVFIVMDHVSYWRTKEGSEREHIKYLIVYAVSFWNAVHQRLKTTRNPRLKIRIDGIVIGRNYAATPYVRKWENKRVLDMYRAAYESSDYWLNVSRIESNFSLDAHHVIATMTHARPTGTARWSEGGLDRPLHLIISDDNKYGALNVLNLESMTNSFEIWSRTNVGCYPDLWSSGNPIRVVPMPGDAMRLNQQCQALGWTKNNVVCLQEDHCEKLSCRMNLESSSCDYFHDKRPAVDGSFCQTGGICMGGWCVPNTTVSY